MFSQFFGQYLLDNQKITAEQFSSCMKYIKDNRVKLGLIAENEGLLTRNQANELNYLQMQTDKRFGDLAAPFCGAHGIISFLREFCFRFRQSSRQSFLLPHLLPRRVPHQR